MMKRILVVDDENDILTVLEMVLQMEGYEVITASNGKTAIEQIAAARPDIVISDIMMPVMNGLQLLKRLKSNSEFAKVPVIMISAVRPDPDPANQWDAFLGKPLDLDKLLVTIHKNLKNN